MKLEGAKVDDVQANELLRNQAIASFQRMQKSAKSIERAGYKLRKRWLAADDLRVRPAHRKANGQIREIDEPFDVGGEKLLHPHDPNGSHDNTYLCRCVAQPVVLQRNINREWEEQK